MSDPSAESHTVWVATATLPATDRSEADHGLLDDEERARTEGFSSGAARRRYIGSHAFLRRVLADHLGTDPAEVSYDRTCEHCGHPRHGRPRLVGTGAGLSFSFSHSGPYVMVAVADTLVGVDIEDTSRRPVAERVIRRICTAGEQVWLTTMPEAERMLAFLAIWTRKEAVAKALGLGLVLPFNSFEVSGPEPVRARPGAAALVAHPVALPGAVAAVAAVPGAAVERSQRWWMAATTNARQR